MVLKRRDVDILIVSDSIDEISDVEKLLEGKFKNIHKAFGVESAVEYFLRKKPAVIIAAFDEIADSLKLSQMIKSQLEVESVYIYKFLVFCKHSESLAAYEFCMKEEFDNYVIDRPLYDKHLVTMTVMNALRIIELESQHSLEKEELVLNSEASTKFRADVETRVLENQHHFGEMTKSFEDFSNNLGADINTLESSIISEHPIHSESLNQHFSTFRTESLKKPAEKFQNKLDRVSKLLEELKGQVETSKSEDVVISKKQKHLILLVDDDQFYLDHLKSVFTSSGYLVATAVGGMEALHLLENSDPSAILLDYSMPELNGVSVLRMIKQNPKVKHIPVLMLTGNRSTSIVKASLQNGATDYIVKPCEKDALLAKVERVLAISSNQVVQG